MICGIGTDVVDIAGFREQLDDSASGFVSATFTGQEQVYVNQRPQPYASFAARFAAKEAFIKAWSGSRYGFPPHRPHVDLREIEVTQDGYGRPRLQLHGQVQMLVNSEHSVHRTHLSISHDGDIASAFVVFETFPESA